MNINLLTKWVCVKILIRELNRYFVPHSRFPSKEMAFATGCFLKLLNEGGLQWAVIDKGQFNLPISQTHSGSS